jgi:PAS domain S-box-containing protein/putative nucleotidyltransferase with HDIG domain
MKDRDKSQKQLITELTQLRQRIAELEESAREHKQVEEILKKSEHERAAVFDSISEHVVYQDTRMVVLWTNRAAGESVGADPQQLVGHHCYEIWQQRRKPCIGCPVVKARKSGQPREAEMTTPDGRVWYIRGYPVRSTKGNIIGAVEVTLDITEGKQIEDTLRETSLFLRSILDSSSSISIIFTDLEQNILFWNKGAENIFGYGAEEVVDRHTVDILYPDEGDTKQTVEEIRSYILNKKRGLRRELKEVTKDGRILWINLTSTPRFDDNGNVIGIVGIGEDITERKQIEEALRASEEQFRQFFENEPEYCYMISPEGLIVNVNNAALSALGYTKEELIGKPLQTIYAPESVPKMEQLYLKWGKTGQLKDEEMVIITKKGDRRTVLLSVGAVRDSDGNIVHSISVQNDITERKNIEDALKESEERFRKVVETMEVGLGTIDENGLFTYVNEYLAKMLGYSIDEMIGRSTLDFYYDEGSRQVQKAIFKKRRAGMRDPTPYEVTWRRKDGQKVYSILSPTPLFDAHGHYTGSFAIHTDITKRKRMEEALRESEEKYRELINGMNDTAWVIDFDGKFIDVNNAAVEVIGYSREELLSMGPHDIDDTLDAEEIRALIKEMPADKIQVFETTHTTKDGKVIPVEIKSSLVTYQGKRAILSIARDITERKRAEEALNHSYQQMQEMLIAMVNALASTVEMKDQYTAGHQPRVTQLACAIAKEMGLPEEQIEGIRMAGLIHDIGKIMIPAEILNKPGPLTEIQYEMVKMHPRAGYDILKDIKFPWPVAQMVLQHHELMDGSGYPQGLSGEKILLEARILAVANVVEAMVSHRPYRAAYGIKEALAEILKNKGILYDSVVVDACLKLFTEKQFSFDK